MSPRWASPRMPRGAPRRLQDGIFEVACQGLPEVLTHMPSLRRCCPKVFILLTVRLGALISSPDQVAPGTVILDVLLSRRHCAHDVAVLLQAHPPHRHRVAHASSGNSSRHCAHGAPSLCSRCVTVFLSNCHCARGASRCSYKLTHASSGNSSHHCAHGALRCCYQLTRPISTGWLRQGQANS